MKYSLLFPTGYEVFNDVNEVTIHDLGMDIICNKVGQNEKERKLIYRILSKMTKDPYVAKYRMDVFDDIYHQKEMRTKIVEILEKIDFLKEYGSFKREYDESAGMWDLMHRFDELQDYIHCVDAIYMCLDEINLTSSGLIGLKEYVKSLYNDAGMKELKADIEALKASTSSMKSVTVGINLNSRFEAAGIGLISVNDKPFTKSNVLSNFLEHVSTKDQIKEGNEWNNDYKFHPLGKGTVIEKGLNAAEAVTRMTVAVANPILAGLARPAEGDPSGDVTMYMDRIVNHMLTSMVKKLRETLNKYISVSITDMTDLIPEFIYYIRFAEYIEGLQAEGASFCKANVVESEEIRTNAKGIYNIKLAALPSGEREEIVKNDLIFDRENTLYVLTGANRGGKTTITQAIGQIFLLAQGGLYVPGDAFEFYPVDNIFTHFPADEDQTMDLGRLGEECKRFKEIYSSATGNSLLLLNETFSTTSFEEGYYIAYDSIKAILSKGIRTIYNTHMHKLAHDIDAINAEMSDYKAKSLVTMAKDGKRSYKVIVAPPEGQSYASDIAKKYGVTYEQLKNM